MCPARPPSTEPSTEASEINFSALQAHNLTGAFNQVEQQVILLEN